MRILRRGNRRGSVSEMLLIVGSLLATIIIIVAAWQLIVFQTSVIESGRLERISREVSKNINFVQQISSPYTLRYRLEENANLSVRNGMVKVSRGNSSASFPYIGFADSSDTLLFTGQALCISNNANTTAIVSVNPC